MAYLSIWIRHQLSKLKLRRSEIQSYDWEKPMENFKLNKVLRSRMRARRLLRVKCHMYGFVRVLSTANSLVEGDSSTQ